jgi:hypothetical protein
MKEHSSLSPRVRLCPLLLAAALLLGAAAPSFRAGGVDFNNFVYPATPGQGSTGPYAVRNGTAVLHQTEVAMEASPNSISTGDMRGDGSLQAAVLLTTSAPVGSTSVLYLFDVHGGHATLLAHFDAFGGGEGGTGIRFRIAKRFLYVELYAPNGPPGTSIVSTYALHGSRLAKVYSLEHRAAAAF